ncbi:ABC-2 family transporter protein [Candidatus Gottesmanbacteria bacterium]|nr:ABC-2 family transporter protein [Candidatus Gottesmanbacteria bacterium]
MEKYIRVWFALSVNSFQVFFLSRVGAILFLSGKIIRFIFYLGFLYLLVSKTRVLSGYSLWEVVLFYLTFNLIDSTTQMLFREVYRFRQMVVSGSFDLLLVKPVNVLFRVLFGGTDFLDLVTLIPFVVFIIITVSHIPYINLPGVILYILLIANALLIAVSFHIFVLSLAVLTSEIDHAIMIYRDFTSMGKIPIDVYGEPFRSFVTFIIPVGIMMSFPVKALVGLLQVESVIIALVVSTTLFLSSLLLWRYSLNTYTSASS